MPQERMWMSRILAAVFWGAMAVALVFLAVLAYWGLRPNRANVHPDLALEHWVAVGDGRHNSNTDMIFWRDRFYMIHASSPWHFASTDCYLAVWRSADARNWEKLTEFSVPGQDIRDPTFAVIDDRLFVYVMKNVDFAAEPYMTQMSVTDDGENWSDLVDVAPEGWLFWRPKTRDGETWYVPAYWHEHGASILLSSTDGVNWTEVATIYEGDRNDETDIAFLPNGRMIATARLEVSDSVFGHPDARTAVCVAPPPYTDWDCAMSDVTRLDGPNLFEYDGAVYAVGRYNPDPPGPLNHFGSILGRKRTSLFHVTPGGLTYLSDLPSAGDTAYAGVVLRGDELYVCYYTSPIEKDYPWIVGMMTPSDIRMAQVGMQSLAALAGAE